MRLPLLFAWPDNQNFAGRLASVGGYELGAIEIREFPDGEIYLRLLAPVEGRSLAIVCTLSRPNDKLLSLMFVAATARELRASSVGLVAPYLAYMRQDRRFKPGEAITSQQVARLLSASFDWLVTVDPHLHRYSSLGEIYRIPTGVAHAAPLVSDWIRHNVRDPLIIGPDQESEQWVAAVANDAGAPHTVLEKQRRGDRDVEIQFENLQRWRDRTPVLVDDIISTGRTMIEATKLLRAQGWSAPICLAVHGLFADKADAVLAKLGARVVITNSVPNAANAADVIDVSSAVASEMNRFLL
jgi:ribose-phosphate pyrophosphokinase